VRIVLAAQYAWRRIDASLQYDYIGFSERDAHVVLEYY
jgi:hypothetical protein